MKVMKIDIFSDVVCPWCFIGTTRLDRVLATTQVAAELVHHPFLLKPDTPEGGLNIHDELRQKYGADPSAMFARVEEAAREAGLVLDLKKQPFMYPTLKAHTLLRAAAKKQTQHALSKALFAAYFLQAKNISDNEVLADVASAHGFAAEEARALVSDADELKTTRAETEQAHAHGISGVPFFVFDDRLAISGAQPDDVFERAMAQARA